MTKVILMMTALMLSQNSRADVDYGLQIKNGTRIATAQTGTRTIWSIDGIAVSKQDNLHAMIDVTVTIANGPCGATELHSNLKYKDVTSPSLEKNTVFYSFDLAVTATGPSKNWMKACYTSHSGPVQIVLEIPVYIMSTDPARQIQYSFFAGESSFSILGQFGKTWQILTPKTQSKVVSK